MDMKRLFVRIVMSVVGFTAIGVLISSKINQQHAGESEDTLYETSRHKLDNHGRIPARRRIEMRIEEALGSKSAASARGPLKYPSWWKESWSRSAVYPYMDKFMGDRPLFPACKHARISSQVKLSGFVEPPPEWLPNSKNPCWYEDKVLKCAPYFYLAGVAKCGTTDIFARIRLHPDVIQGTQKEYHWWDRYRFGNTEGDEELGPKRDPTPFDEYLQQIDGPEIKIIEEEIRAGGESTKLFGDGSPSYLWDIDNWQFLEGNQGCDEPRVTIGQHIRHFSPDAKIIMTFRHPTQRLYSRFLSRIHRVSYLRSATAEDFHNYVVKGTKMYKECFQKSSIRACAYNNTLRVDAVVRLVEGMYPVFLADWFRIWPIEQNLIIRYDDYAKDMKGSLREILNFLELGKIKITEFNMIVDRAFSNIGKMYETIGPMLPETEAILNDFYEPFVLQFSEILGDERFTWSDVKPL